MKEPPGPGGGPGGLKFGLPKLTRAVMVLLIVNCAAFILQLFLDGPRTDYVMRRALALTPGEFWQVCESLTGSQDCRWRSSPSPQSGRGMAGSSARPAECTRSSWPAQY